MIETGFLDPGAARAAVRRMKLRRALRDAGGSVAALLDRLDQQLETDGGAAPALRDGGSNLLTGNAKGCVCRLPVDNVEGEDMREQQLLQGMNLVLQFLDTLLDGLGHGLFSSINSDTLNANPDQPGGASSK
ncbi:hypothetical protein [Novosphingobium naphthalenivorans]|uniref:hypothetical protein n=1 Tax=Novosphingobium naphthalenivorans TaxID=273168 RepID=UPI0008376794|nr:hypothetical protein [Novosphingobium naphthalenivorans]